MLFSNISKLPVGEFDKELIEKTLLWFEEKLGPYFLKSQKYLGPEDFEFPEDEVGDDPIISHLINIIAMHLELDPSAIDYIIEMNDTIEFSEGFGTEGTDDHQKHTLFVITEEGRYKIYISSKTLKDPQRALLHLAYILSYLKLRISNVFTFGNGYMINFAMVIFGFGVAAANGSISSGQWQGISHQGWKVSRFGFINQRMYGYLLALLSEYRHESTWIKYLCADVKAYCNSSLKYISKNPTNISFLNEHPIIPINDEEVFIRKLFYTNGKLRIIERYKNRLWNGIMIFYHENGRLWSEREYKDGVSYTVQSNYDSDGNPVEKGTLHEGNGSLYIYKPNGDLLRIEFYENSKLIEVKK